MIGEYTENVKIINDNLKSRDFITTDGEVVSLSDTTLDGLSMDIVNYSEQLAGVDEQTVSSEETRRILEAKENQSKFHKRLVNDFGAFYFNYYKRFNISRQFLFRFIYICTYMNYDNLLSNGVRLIKKDDLKTLLNLSNTEGNRTVKYFIDNELISYDEKDNIKINTRFCNKGKMEKRSNVEVIRMFDDAIRELYQNSLPREHKKIALLLELLPYINYKYNVVCKNPKETNIELIEPLKMIEVCEIVGYDKANSSKLKRELFSITIKNEYVIGIFEKGCGKAIYVNPRLYYKGGDDEGIDFLANMFVIS